MKKRNEIKSHTTYIVSLHFLLISNKDLNLHFYSTLTYKYKFFFNKRKPQWIVYTIILLKNYVGKPLKL